ncbi:MAG TPA: hypothetical protein VHC41_00375 [Mycobacteriales bacterium]|nr:hypothetical protein [Mycobacteriales bacterium]
MIRRAPRARPRSGGAERGSALVEFVGASVILLLPLIYLLLTVFHLQRASFAASEAAREAGRAFATAPTTAIGLVRATYAARLAFEDQGIDTDPQVVFTAAGAGCGDRATPVTPSLTPGASYTVCVAQDVALPYANNAIAAHYLHARVHVTGRYALSVDRFRAAS